MLDQRTERVYIGIIGARMRSRLCDEQLIRKLVKRLHDIHGAALTIVSGGCKTGPDRFAKDAALDYGVDYLEHPVDGRPKNKHEFRKAAYARNTLVARDSKHSLYAFVQVPRKGGTEDTVTKYQDLIISGEQRKLYLNFPDMSSELWVPEVKIRSSWVVEEETCRRV